MHLSRSLLGAKSTGLLKFFDPEFAAEQVVLGIATCQDVVNIPGYIMPLTVGYRYVRCAAGCVEKSTRWL